MKKGLLIYGAYGYTGELILTLLWEKATISYTGWKQVEIKNWKPFAEKLVRPIALSV